MCKKEMQSEKPTACPVCETVLLWHPAIDAYVCLRCQNIDEINEAWEHDKL